MVFLFVLLRDPKDRFLRSCACSLIFSELLTIGIFEPDLHSSVAVRASAGVRINLLPVALRTDIEDVCRDMEFINQAKNDLLGSVPCKDDISYLFLGWNRCLRPYTISMSGD